MIIHPNIADAAPLLVVGTPRSGTRFVANALNAHPDIHLNGEIPLRAMEETEAWLRRLSDAYEDFAANPRRVGWETGWQTNRHQLVYALWGTLFKGAFKLPDRPVAWYGYKTPHHERFWPLWRDLFPDDRQPRYVFCIRNFLDQSSSQLAKTPKMTIDRIAANYRQSINTYAEMLAELGDHVSLFVLDDLADGGVDYICQAVFDSFGIPVNRDTLVQIDPGRRVNDGASRGREKRPFTDEERAFLGRNRDLLDALDAVRLGKPIAPDNSQ